MEAITVLQTVLDAKIEVARIITYRIVIELAERANLELSSDTIDELCEICEFEGIVDFVQIAFLKIVNGEHSDAKILKNCLNYFDEI